MNARRGDTWFLFHLTGPMRGTIQPLRASRLTLGTSPEAAIHFPPEAGGVQERHAVLERLEGGYAIRALGSAVVRVDGVWVDRRELEPGDILEIGDDGPLLRLRRYEGSGTPRKSVRDAVRDCLASARYGSGTPWGRAALFLAALPREVLTQTAPWPRALILAALAALMTAASLLAFRAWSLERRLDTEAARLWAAAQLLEQMELDRLTPEDLERIRQGLSLYERVEALEARGEAVPTVIERASRSVAFIQGSYGFLDPETGEPIRRVLGSLDQPLLDARGQPVVSAEGGGPMLEMSFTGTAFVVGPDGLLLTNRHVAQPWEFDRAARAAVGRGLVPTMRRMMGYLPGVDEPFPVEPVITSPTADLAVLKGGGPTDTTPPLPLAESMARPGQEVVVLGYPTGVRALLARTNPSFVDTIRRETALDPFAVARRLSAGGYIAPLATRGIVGQTTASFVVYDAETTRGGSGGPVLSLDGRVLAVTVGILPEFGGSNLGVPVSQVRGLLDEAREAYETRSEEAEAEEAEDAEQAAEPDRRAPARSGRSG